MITIHGPRRELNAIAIIAYRDVLRFVRDPSRLIGSLILPIIFVGLLEEASRPALAKALAMIYSL